MDAEALRIARFLVSGEAVCRPAAHSEKITLENPRGVMAASKGVLAAMARRGLVTRRGPRLALTESGAACWRRSRNGAPDFAGQHRDAERGFVEVDGAMTAVTINRAESPLSIIARRKDRDGRTFLSENEFGAGERLRSDYTREQIMPRLGANWQAAVASGHGRGERGGAAELTDAALAARQRVENAICAVGPELAGVLVDVCCYLKGLETVERERGWPVRSAKIVLKSALAALARHYDPAGAGGNARRSVTLHWGAADYRPSLNAR
jgi:hypothetical protein